VRPLRITDPWAFDMTVDIGVHIGAYYYDYTQRAMVEIVRISVIVNNNSIAEK